MSLSFVCDAICNYVSKFVSRGLAHEIAVLVFINSLVMAGGM
jgi:hypothetical protein